MGNIRISQLNNLPASGVSPNDLLIIADISLPETKNITAADLQTYILNGGILTASLDGTASYANVAEYALNAPTSAQVSYSTSSLSSSWASSSLGSISSSYSNTSSYATTASYALVTGLTSSFSQNSTNATSASYLLYVGVPNGTASYAISSSQSNTSNLSLVSNNSLFSNTASIALVALSIAGAGVNQSGNQGSNLVYSNYIYNTASIGAGVNPIVTKSINAQIDSITVNTPFQTSNLVNINCRGLITILHNNIGYQSYWQPTVALIIQDLSTGVTQSLATTSYSTYVLGITNTVTTIATPGTTQRFYLTGSVNISGSYRIYARASYMDDGKGNLSFYFYGTPTFRLESSANNFVISSIPTYFGNTLSEVPVINTDVNGIIFNYSSSWNLFGQVTASNGSDTLYNLTQGSPASSSYITYLNNNGNTFDTITGVWTLSNLNTLILDNSGVSYVDGVPPSLVSMSCQNCNLTTIPSLYQPSTLTPNPTYSMSYLNISNNSITDLSDLPLSMSYLNASRNAGISNLPATMPKGIRYVDITYCSLHIDDLDSITSMLASEVSASNIIGGTLNVYAGNDPILAGTVSSYNIVYLSGAPYGWSVT